MAYRSDVMRFISPPLRASGAAWRLCGVLSAALVIASCEQQPTPEDAGPAVDPCAPGGHVHREGAAAWCHCERGFLSVPSALSCEPDPTFVEGPVKFGASDARACWHVTHGPHGLLPEAGGSLDAFLTHYRLEFAGGALAGSYHAAVTGTHVVSVSEQVSLSVTELSPAGAERPLAARASRQVTFCPELGWQHAFEFDDRVNYRLHFTSTTPGPGAVVLDHLE
jgi:hypothetical protein